MEKNNFRTYSLPQMSRDASPKRFIFISPRYPEHNIDVDLFNGDTIYCTNSDKFKQH